MFGDRGTRMITLPAGYFRYSIDDAVEGYLLICAVDTASVGVVKDICVRQIPNRLTGSDLLTILCSVSTMLSAGGDLRACDGC